MGKSLFLKLFLVYAGVLASVVAVISLMLSLLYTERMYEEKHQALTSAGTMVNRTMGEYLDGVIGKDRLSTSIDMIGYIADARIYAIRYDAASLSEIAKELADSSQADVNLVGDMSALLEGSSVFRSRAYSAKLDTDVVLAGFPLTHGTQVLGGIIMYAPLDRVTQDVWQMNLVVFCVALGALMVGTLMILQLTRRIIRPIRDMQSAVVRLASGEVTDPVPVNTRDEIGRLARAFNHMQEQLTKTEEVRRGFIANVSHELRTPLTSIRGFLQGMLDGVIRQEAVREHLLLMMDEVMRLNNLTGEILDLAKLQSGTLTLVKERVDLRTVARETVAALKGFIGEKDLSISVEPGEPVYAYVDQDRIRQVLINLVGNSIKFTPDGGSIEVGVSMKESHAESLKEARKDMPGDVRREPAGMRVMLQVRDTGIGIPEEELPLVFDKFHRVDKSGNPAYGGSGLGLNIAKTIVELHRGIISAARRPGGGTEFTVELPES
jgi:signal transduction histidine kinase